MSELIATSSGEIRARDAILGYWWYEKSEADAVIAEKDAEHEAELDKWYAKLCRNRWRRAYAMYQHCCAMNRLECGASPATMEMHQFWRYHTGYWSRWMRRWLKVYLEYKERIG